jgi:hypothetical protein
MQIINHIITYTSQPYARQLYCLYFRQYMKSSFTSYSISTIRHHLLLCILLNNIGCMQFTTMHFTPQYDVQLTQQYDMHSTQGMASGSDSHLQQLSSTQQRELERVRNKLQQARQTISQRLLTEQTINCTVGSV